MNTRNMILICKALSDTKRLEIVQILSDGEKCGCKILDKFNITQPTLSHHMKILVDCGIVNDRKEGKRHYYSLNKKVIREAHRPINRIGRILEFGMKRGVMLPSTGHRIRPLRSE